MSTITFRDVTEADAERLLEIYAYYVEKSAISFECTVPTIEEFKDRIKHIKETYPYIAACENGRIVGYAYAGPFIAREAYGHSVETTIYLDKEAQNRGIGKKLYNILEIALKFMNILNLYACIGYPEQDDEYLTRKSADFHAHLGYRIVGRFCKCGNKFGRWYDMVWMEKYIGVHDEQPLPVIPYPIVKGAMNKSKKES